MLCGRRGADLPTNSRDAYGPPTAHELAARLLSIDESTQALGRADRAHAVPEEIFSVGEEDTRKPLSDSQISEVLGKQGIMVARRTIAKYRESLQILPVNLRKSI